MLSKALAELGGHFPPDSPEREALAAKIMMLVKAEPTDRREQEVAERPKCYSTSLILSGAAKG
ncbi:hypothetical protein [Mesorhizobium sp. Arg314]